MSSPNLVSATDLRRVTQGSYEQRMSRIHEAVISKLVDKFECESTDVKVLATFDEDVVAQVDGKVHRVRVQESDTGDVHVVSCVEEDVPVYNLDNAHEFVEAEVGLAVDQYLKGDITGAKVRIESVLPYVSSTPKGSEDTVLHTVESALSASRLWKRIYEQRKSQITKYVVNHLEAIEANRLEPKFSKLSDGLVEESDQSSYSDLVNEDLEYVLSRYESLRSNIQEAVDAAEDGLEKAKKSGSEVVDVYERFSEDLLNDLDRINNLNKRVLGKVTSVAGRGKLRDTLAEDLYTMEVAGRFITEVSTRLSEVAK